MISGARTSHRLRLVDVNTMTASPPLATNAIRLAYTPDRKRLVTAGTVSLLQFGNAELAVRDAATGKVQMSLHGHKDPIAAVSVSADSRWLVSASASLTNHESPGAIMVWDLANKGARVLNIPQERQALGAAIHPDGRLIAAACRDGVVRLWDRETGRLVKDLTGHASGVKSVAFRPPDGRQLASGDFAGSILLWDTVTFEKQRELRDRSASASYGFTALTYSQDGRRLASATYGQPGGEVRLWDPDTGVEAIALEGKLAVAISPDGHKVAAGAGGGKDSLHLRVWDGTPGPLVMARKQKNSNAHVHGVAASPDGQSFATAGDDGVVRVWSADTGEVLRALTPKPRAGASSAAFSPDGRRLATGSHDNVVRVWRLDTGEVERSMAGHEKAPRWLAWLDDRRLVSGGEDKTVRVWDSTTGATLHRLEVGGWPLPVAASPDGKRILVGAAGCRVYDAGTGALLFEAEKEKGGHWSVAFRPDGRRFASASDSGRVRVYDAADGKPVLEVARRPSAVFALDWSRDGRRLVSAGADPALLVHDAESGALVTSLVGYSPQVHALACLGGGLVACGGNGGEVRLWRLPR
ncbi:MAG: hypothetical protein U0797_29875 [Gemmataceae bacterium]